MFWLKQGNELGEESLSASVTMHTQICVLAWYFPFKSFLWSFYQFFPRIQAKQLFYGLYLR